MAFLAGTALATSGMVFQAMFRNPLATPFTLGVSSGASLGAPSAIQQGWTFAVLGISSVSLSAFLGARALDRAGLSARRAGSRQGSSTATMLLAGVAVSFFFSSLISLPAIHQRFHPHLPHAPLGRWAGWKASSTFHDVLNVFPFVVAGCLIVWYLTHELNLLTTGEEFAFSRGVNVKQTKLSLLFFARVADGRRGGGRLRADRIRGPDGAAHLPPAGRPRPSLAVSGHVALRRRIPGDLRHRRPLHSGSTELPVGILTALLGGPFFIVVLMRRRHDLGERPLD